MTDTAESISAQGLADIGWQPAKRKDRVRPAKPADDLAWHDQAACQGMNPDLFFAEDGWAVTEVVEACRSCPVREQCLAWALDHEHFGYWAGTTERQRRQMRRRRRAG